MSEGCLFNETVIRGLLSLMKLLAAASGKGLVVDLDKQTRLKMIPHVVQVQVRRDTLMLGFGVWHV